MKSDKIPPEQQNIEYKSSWRYELLKWVGGFANANGGVIFIGKDDDGNVCRIDTLNGSVIIFEIPPAPVGIPFDGIIDVDKERYESIWEDYRVARKTLIEINEDIFPTLDQITLSPIRNYMIQF